MQFQHSEWLYTLWLVALLFLFFLWTWKRKRRLLKTFARSGTLPVLIRSHSYSKERLKKGMLLAGLILLFLTIAQPQWGEIKKEIKRKGVDVMFLVDTSLSMLAEDTAPSRIEKAKLEMKSFLRQLKGDRIGIVTFAGSGFVQSPLTLDYDAFLLFANSIQVGYIPDAGTSLREAIQTAVKVFSKSKQKNNAIILLSDGEDLEGDVESSINMVKDAKIRIYTIGFGTKEGAPIPLRSDQGKVSGYKKDRSGEIVITKLNEPLLMKAAEETGGLYFLTTPSEREVEWIYQHMQNIEKKEFKQREIVEREDHFQIFLFFAILILMLELFVSETRKEENYA